jgi:uncharacterized RDD family membrane protein YckC
MNLESVKNSKNTPPAIDLELDEFDFKPITSGLGFNQNQKTTEVKPAFVERPMPVRETKPVRTAPVARQEMNVYQNDLSLFYGQTEQIKAAPAIEAKPEKIYRTATKIDRVVAYVLDMALITSVLSVMLMFMTRALDMEIMEAWAQYPDEVTPLIVTLFCGFYVLYFAVGEKTGATLGKSLMNIRLVDTDNRNQNFMTLIVRSLITLTNFASLGLFSYFDLQNKATGSKVIKAD